jgi:dipeptide/tripeptide permease
MYSISSSIGFRSLNYDLQGRQKVADYITIRCLQVLFWILYLQMISISPHTSAPRCHMRRW